MIPLRVALLGAALCLSPGVWAKQQVVWSTPAMACIPTAATVAEGKYDTTAGRIKFKDGQTGTLSFLCPVTALLVNGTYILEGRANSTYSVGVGFELRRVNLESGEVTTLIQTNALDTTKAVAFRPIVNVDPAPLTFDSGPYTYWVQITHKLPGVSILAVSLLRLPDPAPQTTN